MSEKWAKSDYFRTLYCFIESEIRANATGMRLAHLTPQGATNLLFKEQNFFENLSQGLADLLNQVLSEPAGLFRRGRTVIAGQTNESNNSNYTLQLLEPRWNELEKGTFTIRKSEDVFLVYRNPSKVTVRYALLASDLQTNEVLNAYDKIHSYFFDHRTLEPIIPTHLRNNPFLNERLTSLKAEIRPIASQELSFKGNEFSSLFQFSFDYTALYHSGNALREETKTKSRIFEFGSEEPSSSKNQGPLFERSAQ